VFVKVGGHYGDTRYKKDASPDANADTLREEGLIVLLHQASRHHAENNEKRPHTHEGASIPRIKKRSGQCADKQQEEGLD
jgi:hypothetical protein